MTTYYQILIWKGGKVINATTKKSKAACIAWAVGTDYDHYTIEAETFNW